MGHTHSTETRSPSFPSPPPEPALVLRTSPCAFTTCTANGVITMCTHMCTHTRRAHTLITHSAHSGGSKCSGCQPIVPRSQGLPYPPVHAHMLWVTYTHNPCPGDPHIGQKSLPATCSGSTQNKYSTHVNNLCTHTQHPQAPRGQPREGTERGRGTPCLLPGDKLRPGGSGTETG